MSAFTHGFREGVEIHSGAYLLIFEPFKLDFLSHKWDFSKILPHDKINQIIKNAISLILRWDQLRSTKNLELAHLRRGPLFLGVWIFNRWSP